VCHDSRIQLEFERITRAGWVLRARSGGARGNRRLFVTLWQIPTAVCWEKQTFPPLALPGEQGIFTICLQDEGVQSGGGVLTASRTRRRVDKQGAARWPQGAAIEIIHHGPADSTPHLLSFVRSPLTTHLAILERRLEKTCAARCGALVAVSMQVARLLIPTAKGMWKNIGICALCRTTPNKLSRRLLIVLKSFLVTIGALAPNYSCLYSCILSQFRVWGG